MANSLLDQFNVGNLIQDYLRSDVTGTLPADSPYTMRRGDVDEARRTMQLLDQLPPGSEWRGSIPTLQDAMVPGYSEERQAGNISRLQVFEEEQLLAENHRTEVARAERMKLVLNSAKDKEAFETFFAANSGTTAKDLSPATKKSLEAWRNRFVALWDKLAGIPVDKMTQVQSSWATEEIEELVRSVPRYEGLSGPAPTASQPLIEESFLKKLLTLPVQANQSIQNAAGKIGDYVTDLKQSGSAMWADVLKTPEAEMLREPGGVLDPRPSAEEAAAFGKFIGTPATELMRKYIGIGEGPREARRGVYDSIGQAKEAVISAPFDAAEYVDNALIDPMSKFFQSGVDTASEALDAAKAHIQTTMDRGRSFREGDTRINLTTEAAKARDAIIDRLGGITPFSQGQDQYVAEGRFPAGSAESGATTLDHLTSMAGNVQDTLVRKAEDVAEVSRPVLDAAARKYRGLFPDAYPALGLDANSVIANNLKLGEEVGGAANVPVEEAASPPTPVTNAVLDGARLRENLTARKEKQAAEKQTRGLLDFVIGRETAQKVRDAVGYEKDSWQAPGTGIISVLQNMMANPLAAAPGVSGWGQVGYAGEAARRSAAAGAIAAQEASAKSATAQAALINANAPRQIKEAGNLKILRNIGTMHSMTDIIAKYKDLLSAPGVKLTGGGPALQGAFIKAARLIGIDIGSTPKETLQMMSQSLQELFTELYGQQVSKREMKALDKAIESGFGATGLILESDVHILAQLNNLLEKIARDQKTFSTALRSQGYGVQVDAMGRAYSTEVAPETMAITSRTDRQ